MDTRTYDFLASILPYTNAEWEKLSIFLNLLIPKLPAPKEEDLSRGILETIDMDSYRAEKKAAMKIALADDEAEIDPASIGGGGRKPEPELDRLSNILKTFNEKFGTLFTDADRVAKRITEDIAPKGRGRPGLPERKSEHAERGTHRARRCVNARYRSAAEGRYRVLQTIRSERIVSARRHGRGPGSNECSAVDGRALS